MWTPLPHRYLNKSRFRRLDDPVRIDGPLGRTLPIGNHFALTSARQKAGRGPKATVELRAVEPTDRSL